VDVPEDPDEAAALLVLSEEYLVPALKKACELALLNQVDHPDIRDSNRLRPALEHNFPIHAGCRKVVRCLAFECMDFMWHRLSSSSTYSASPLPYRLGSSSQKGGLTDFVQSVCQVKERNVCNLFRIAHLHDATFLKEKCKQYFLDHFDTKTFLGEELKKTPSLLLEITLAAVSGNKRRRLN
jgi:hypothetical protein